MNIQKARECVQFCGIMRRTEGKPSLVYTPASPEYEGRKRGEPRCAEVSIERARNIMKVTCRVRTVHGDGDFVNCQGMENGHICYHALAAVLVCATESNLKCEFVSEINGTNATIQAGYGSGKVYVKYK